MPSVSSSQQHLMGMALAVKRGEKKLSDLPEGVRADVRRILKMSEAKLREFALKKRESARASTGDRMHSRRLRRARVA